MSLLPHMGLKFIHVSKMGPGRLFDQFVYRKIYHMKYASSYIWFIFCFAMSSDWRDFLSTLVRVASRALHLSYHCPTGHCNDVIMDTIASQITSLAVVYSTVYSDADQRKHQSSASLAFVWGIHRGPVNSPHKWPVTRKMFPFNDVTMITNCTTKRELCAHI